MRSKSKIAVPLLAALAVAGTFITVMPGGEGDGSVAVNKPAVSQEPAAKAYVGNPDDPATWKLPVEAYMPTQAETRLLSSSRDEAIKNCMANSGYPDWKPAPDLPPVRGETLTDWRYGIHEIDQATKNGYHPDPGRQAAYEATLAADESMNADQDVLRNCATQTDAAGLLVQQSPLISEINGNSYEKATESAAVKKIFALWSACMRDKGFTYREPMDASDHFMAGTDEVSAAEKRTAVADVECRERHRVQQIWFEAEVAIQQQEIAGRLNDLKRHRAAVKAAVAGARSTAQGATR
ncbi:hypothetical protein AB0N23_02920 [Streptomyces sp. NPDC052644]